MQVPFTNMDKHITGVAVHRPITLDQAYELMGYSYSCQRGPGLPPHPYACMTHIIVIANTIMHDTKVAFMVADANRATGYRMWFIIDDIPWIVITSMYCRKLNHNNYKWCPLEAQMYFVEHSPIPAGTVLKPCTLVTHG